MSLFSRLFQQKDATDPAAPPAADDAAAAEDDIAVEEEAAALPQALVTTDETDPMPLDAEADVVETKLDTGELEAFVVPDPDEDEDEDEPDLVVEPFAGAILEAESSSEIDPEVLSRPLPPPPPPLPPPPPPRRGRRERTGRHAKSKLAPGLTPPLRQSQPASREADRREPLIVKALLRQVPGLEPVAIERLRAAGLGRLDALARASASEMTSDAGLPDEVAKALVSTVRAFRKQSPDAVPDRRSLEPLVSTLEAQHQAFEHAAQGWSAESLAAKRRLRRARAQAYLQVEMALARLGEADLLVRLEPLPFTGKIEELRRTLAPAPAAPRDTTAAVEAEAPLSNEEGTQDGRADT